MSTDEARDEIDVHILSQMLMVTKKTCLDNGERHVLAERVPATSHAALDSNQTRANRALSPRLLGQLERAGGGLASQMSRVNEFDHRRRRSRCGCRRRCSDSSGQCSSLKNKQQRCGWTSTKQHSVDGF